MRRRLTNAVAIACLLLWIEAAWTHYELYRTVPPSPFNQPRTAIALVQSPTPANYGPSSSSQTATFTSNVTSGNLILVSVAATVAGNYGQAYYPLQSVSDSQGNYYKLVNYFSTLLSAGDAYIYVWYAIAGTTAANTVTVNPGLANVAMTIGLHEYSGADNVSPNMGFTGNRTLLSNTSDCGTCQVYESNTMVFCAFSGYVIPPGAITWSAGSGYTLRCNYGGSGDATSAALATQDKIGVSTNQSTSITSTNAVRVVGVAVAIRSIQTPSASIAAVPGQALTYAENSSATANVTYPKSTTIGNTLVACINIINAVSPVGTPPLVSDNLNGNWTLGVGAYNNNVSSKNYTSIWYVKVTSAGSTTLTVNNSQSTVIAISINEYSHILGFDQSNSATGNNTAPATGNITTTVANELYVSCCSWANYDSGTAYGVLSSGWTHLDPQPATLGGTSGTTSIMAQTLGEISNQAAGTYSATFSTGGSTAQNWSAVIGSFTPMAATITVNPTSVPPGQAESITVTGTGTNFTGNPIIASGGTITSQVINSPTSVTITFISPINPQTILIADKGSGATTSLQMNTQIYNLISWDNDTPYTVFGPVIVSGVDTGTTSPVSGSVWVAIQTQLSDGIWYDLAWFEVPASYSTSTPSSPVITPNTIDGILYCNAAIIPVSEADLWNLTGLAQHPISVDFHDSLYLFASIAITLSGTPSSDGTYIGAIGSGEIVPSWVPYRTLGTDPGASGTNNIPLGGAFRFTGENNLSQGMATVTIYYKIQGLE